MRHPDALPERLDDQDQAPPVETSQGLLAAIEHRLTSLTAPPPDDLPYTDAPLLYVMDLPASLEQDMTVLTVMHQRRIKGGGLTKPKTIDLSIDDVTYATGVDRRWLALLLGGARHEGDGTYGHDRASFGLRRPATFLLPAPLAQELLPQIGRMARAWLKPARNADPVPLAWDDGDPWRFRLRVSESDDRFEIDGELFRDQARLRLDEPFLLAGTGLVAMRRTLGRFEPDDQMAFIPELRRTRPIVVPRAEAARLAWLLARSGVPPASLPDALHGIDVQAPPSPWLSLRRTGDAQTLLGHVSFDYDGTRVHPRDDAAIVFDRARGRVIHRDTAAEALAVDRLFALGLSPASDDRDAAYVHVDDVATVARTLIGDGWNVQVDGNRYRLPGSVHLSVTSGIDWFDLSATVSYASERVPLTTILDALRDGAQAIVLGDGTMGVLPEEWLQQYAAIAATGAIEDDRIRFSRAQGALVDALLAEREAEADVQVDATFARVRRELAAFSHITPLDPEPSFTGTLRPYQREGLGWFTFLRQFGFGGCLADDMGLGKTIMVLALLDSRRSATLAPDDTHRPSLVVVPRSLVGNWMDEAGRFTPALRVLDAAHAKRSVDAETRAGYDVVLVTYGTLRRDIGELSEIEFDYIVLDEAQTIKNAGTAAAKAARLLKGHHRLALSGTPIENHLGELWSLFEFLNPGVLGRAKMFERAAAASGHDAAHLLSRGLRPFILRRTKAQVATELPPRTEQTILCDLDTHERALYDGLRRHYRQTLLARVNREGIAKSKMHVLEALLRLRQAACHGGLVDEAKQKDSSAKFDVLIPRLQELVDEGHKAIVFSQFTSLLALLREQLDAVKLPYEYLDGRTRNREERVERFQTDPSVPLFLISLKAGGLGLNLTSAAYVFLLDPWWNPAVEAQAIDRAHRIGQTREVFAYRLIARDTVEEKVLELQQSKRDLADAVLAADAVGLRHLEREDLELLLS
jgi:superfamily II DNA or RNA helicase